jgi:hypothetical protein
MGVEGRTIGVRIEIAAGKCVIAAAARPSATVMLATIEPPL